MPDQLYPAWRYHVTLPAKLVADAAEDAALDAEWMDSPHKMWALQKALAEQPVVELPIVEEPPPVVEQPIAEEPPGLELPIVEPDSDPEPPRRRRK